jgi:hypothetical protein
MSYGKCLKCYYWSEMTAQCQGLSPIEALCLNPKSKFNSKYMTIRNGCEAFKYSADNKRVDTEEQYANQN